MIFKPLFSKRKTNSVKIKKDFQYFNTFYKIKLSHNEKIILEKDIMKMKFVLVKNIHDLVYLAKSGVDKDNYGFYSLSGSGEALISVQNKFRIHEVNLRKAINVFLALRDDDIDITLLYDILIKRISLRESKKGIVKHYAITNYYKINRLDQFTKLLNTNVFELIKSRYKDDDSHYRNLIKKFLSELLKLIKKQYSYDMFLYKNVITDKKSECEIYLDYGMVLALISRPKLYIGVSVTHKPYVYVDLDNVQYKKKLFVLFKVIGDDMKVSVYEYYVSKESNHIDQYKLLFDIDLKGTKYYNNIFPEIKVHFDDIKNEKMSLISSY